MKMMKFLSTVATTATLALPVAGAFIPSASYAQGVPVIDTRSLLQQLETFQQLLVDAGLQEEQIAKLIEQIELLDEQLNKLTEKAYPLGSGLPTSCE